MRIRAAAVAGTFYPEDRDQLTREVSAMLAVPEKAELRPKALIVPHAGYIYSGPVAASAYALLAPLAGQIRRVVLLGPGHRVAVRGLALPDADAFETPMGRVAIDLAAAGQIAHLPQVAANPRAHAQEHSLEVQLPFLQKLLPEFKVLPLVVGEASPEEVAEVLEILWGGPETLILISSDLSHFLPYATAKQVDGRTAQAILQLHGPLSHEQACGGTPVNGLLLAARRHGLTPHLLDLRNSGDTAGTRDQVVGYGAFAFAEPPVADKGRTLLMLARNAIAQHFGMPAQPVGQPDWLLEPAATFVTLTQRGQLRGCIGSLEARRPLGQDVVANALAAAFRDPRFPPLAKAELTTTRIEVSLLSPQQPVTFRDEPDALSQLRPGVDGIVFACGSHRSTFLPQVWEQVPQPDQFMAQLKRKAGLAGDFWSPEVTLHRYTVEKWKE
ncbi:MAG: AmmeMemoRadiSam system protein B [Verrucomicrobiota bacterium]